MREGGREGGGREGGRERGRREKEREGGREGGRRLSAFDDAVMGHFVDHLSRDFQPKGCDVTVLNFVHRRHTSERVPNA